MAAMRRPRVALVWALLLALLAQLAAACGPTCGSIRALRAELPGERPPVRGPHATATMSYATANHLVAEALPAVPPHPIDVPAVLRPLVPRLDIAAASVRLRPEGPDKVVAAIDLSLRADGHPLLSMFVDAEIVPRVLQTDEGAWLSIGFGPDNITSVRPRLPPNAARALADAIYAILPAAARDRLPRLVVAPAAAAIAADLTDRTYKMLRTTLLVRVGEVTSLRMPLLDLPVDRVRLHSTAGDDPALVVDLHSTLPVRRGVAGDRAPSVDGAAVIRMSGSTAAELANWAMDTERAPRRFNRKLEPTDTGDYRIALDWIAGEQRPLKVHVFRPSGHCAYVRVGARPVLRVEGDTIAATVLDRRNERVQGSALTKTLLWVKELVRSAAKWKHIAATAHATVGPRRVTTTVVGATVDGDELVVEARLGLGPPEPTRQSTE